MSRERTLPSKYELEELYTRQHLTLQQIADKYGVSRAAVHKALKSIGVTGAEGTQVTVECAHCNAAITKLRSRWRKTKKHYCDAGCYTESMRNPDFISDRQEQNRSRKEVSKYFPLMPGMIVHHHDSNQGNADIHNLAVFANRSDHCSFERGGDVRPLWDGRAVRKTAPVFKELFPYF